MGLFSNTHSNRHRKGEDSRSFAGLLFIVAAAFVWLMPLPGMAQEGDQGVRVRVVSRVDGERVPLEGVRILVIDRSGTTVAEGATNAEGTVDLAVTTPSVYRVEIDPTTIPEDVLADPEDIAREANVQTGRFSQVIFQVSAEEGGITGSSITLRRVLQLSTEGIKLGLFLAMAAIGLSLIFGTTGLVNFAHAELVTWGMLVAYFFNVLGLVGVFGFMSGWPWIFGGPVDLFTSAALAMFFGGLAGWAADAGVFARLRRRGTGLIAQMVVTIGLGIFVRYIFLYIFGGTGRFFRSYPGQQAITLGPVAVTPKDLVAMGVAVVALVGVGLVLQLTRVGRAMRAVSDNRDLAASSGIDVARVIRWVWVAGAALAALGGVLLGQSDVIRWDVGSNILLLMFAGVTLGGLGTAYGALLGCLMVGLGIQLSTLFLASELRSVGALVLLAVILLIRPQGILGRKERVG
ncbi:MAG TPA: branched-chain amino acid ABC transporter permease [Acidimicrobiia bacterium]|nr:branched-chain amino acid ABC transporter permease [Acidimicrobiia bacterium]